MRKEKLSKKIKDESGMASTKIYHFDAFRGKVEITMNNINNRYEFTIIFEVENRNFNEDIYSVNDFMVDWETNYSIVTDSCLKRKIRHRVSHSCEEKEAYKIFFKADNPIDQKCAEAYKACGLKTGEKGKDRSAVSVVNDYMCKNYYDVRTFGAVMDDCENPCGSVHGPVQITFARSFDPVFLQKDMIPKDFSDVNETEENKKSEGHYALYRADGFVSALKAKKTNFSEEDLEILWNAIIHMFDVKQRTANGKFRLRKLIVFKHSSQLGNAPANILLDKVVVKKKDCVEEPSGFSDYTVTIEEMPNGVEVIEKL